MWETQDTRQSALSKSLSAALLNHQISELEARVQSANLGTNGSLKAGMAKMEDNDQRVRIPGGAPTPKPHAGPRDPAAVPKPDARIEALKVGRIDDEPVDERVAVMTHAEDFDFSDIAEEDDEAWRVIVLDASVMIWALRSVRRIVGKGWEVIVPLETITTLDLLKKGSSHRATGARAATRYIEHAARQHKPLSHDPSISVQASTHYRRGRGLRLQREHETVPLSGLTELPVPLEDVPRWSASILGCAGYFARINAAESNEHGYSAGLERATLYVANLPLDVEILDEERDKYADRGEGHEIISEAGRFELSVEVVRDEELEDIAFGEDGRVSGRPRGRGRGAGGAGAGAGGERGRGRGRGRGGLNGSGTREKDESVQEVKILLRRPQAAQAGSVGSAGDDHDHGAESGGEHGPARVYTTTHTQKSGNSPGTAVSHLPPASQIKAPVLMKRDAAGSGAESAFKLLSKDDAKVPSPAPPSAALRSQRRETEWEREGRVYPAQNETHFVLLKRPEPKADGARERGANGNASGGGHASRDEGTRERTVSARGKGRGRGGKAGQGRQRRGSMSTDVSSSAVSSDNDNDNDGFRGPRRGPRNGRQERTAGDAESGQRGRNSGKQDAKDKAAKPPAPASGAVQGPAVKLLQRALAGSTEKDKGPIISPVPVHLTDAASAPSAPQVTAAVPATTAQPTNPSQAFSPPSFLSHMDAASWQPPPEFKPRDFHPPPPPPPAGPHHAPAPGFPPRAPHMPFGHHAPPRPGPGPGPFGLGRPPRPPPPFGPHGHGHGMRPPAPLAQQGQALYGVAQQSRAASQGVSRNGRSSAPVNAPTHPRNGRHDHALGKGKDEQVSIAPGWYESGFGGSPRVHENSAATPNATAIGPRSHSGHGHSRNPRQANGSNAGPDKRERAKKSDKEKEKEQDADKAPVPPKPKVKRQAGSGPAGRGAFKAPVGSYRDDDEGPG